MICVLKSFISGMDCATFLAFFVPLLWVLDGASHGTCGPAHTVVAGQSAS